MGEEGAYGAQKFRGSQTEGVTLGKLPWFPFYPGDWMKDPELRSVSTEARGLWVDMLCLMFESSRRGYLLLNNYKSVTPAMLARMTGCLEGKIGVLLAELEQSGVFSKDESGCIFSRRMVKDQQDREKGNERVKRHRNGSVTDDVTVSVTPSAVDEDVNDNEVDSELPNQVFEIWKIYPRNGHRTNKPSQADESAIAEAIVRDGRDLVLEGTKNYAEAVSRWPVAEKKFAFSTFNFFQTQEYRKDPAEWEKSDHRSERDAKNVAEANVGVWRPS